jgi:hypothetical protein
LEGTLKRTAKARKAIGVVRFRPKPGEEAEFERLFTSMTREFAGLRRAMLVKAQDDRYFSIGEWDSFETMAAARPAMVGNLDKFRHTLLEFEKTGVTDPISGEVVHSQRYDGKVRSARDRKSG